VQPTTLAEWGYNYLRETVFREQKNIEIAPRDPRNQQLLCDSSKKVQIAIYV